MVIIMDVFIRLFCHNATLGTLLSPPMRPTPRRFKADASYAVVPVSAIAGAPQDGKPAVAR